MLFDGGTNRFLEMPKSSEVNDLERFEKISDKLLGRVGAPRKSKNFGK